MVNTARAIGDSNRGPDWSEMHNRKRRSMRTLQKADLPTAPGVYVLYRDGAPMYVGKATSLQDRVWKNHSGRGLRMGSSAMRRNVAEYLGIAKAKDIKSGIHRITVEEAASVRTWLDDGEIAWRECRDAAAAEKLESEMKAEYRPPLTKR
jgi:hypothetical protein